MEEKRESFTLTSEGKKLFGIFHYPKTRQEKCPLVLFLHGFAGNKIGRHRLYVQQAALLCRLGIGAVRFDARGCGDSEGELQDITLSGKLSDALCAYDYAASLPWVDKERIGLIGISLGGAIAVKLAARERAVSTLALWAPVALGKQWIEDWQRHFPEEAQKGHRKGFSAVCQEFLKEFRDLSVEDDVLATQNIPLLHIQGEKDNNVLPSHAALYRKWRFDPISEDRFILLPHSEHDLTQDRETVLQETAEWFKRFL